MAKFRNATLTIAGSRIARLVHRLPLEQLNPQGNKVVKPQSRRALNVILIRDCAKLQIFMSSKIDVPVVNGIGAAWGSGNPRLSGCGFRVQGLRFRVHG